MNGFNRRRSLSELNVNESPIKNVSDTAFMVAAYRALESERADALFRDPLAGRLAGENGRRIIENLPKAAFMGGWSVIIRTRIIDEMIDAAIAEGIDTILNLGAGLDTRPYRMDLPASLRWTEVDFPDILEFKESRLAQESPRCRLERFKLDLSDSPKRKQLLSEIADDSKKILVLTEGVIPYLSPEEVASLAADLRSQASFRYWVADYFSPASYRYRRRKGITEALKNAPFRFEPMDYFGFFGKLGWRPKVIRYIAEEGEKLHRPIPLPWPRRQWLKFIRLFLSPERRAAMMQFMGYVLFEPVR